jgi:hypothetical protein
MDAAVRNRLRLTLTLALSLLPRWARHDFWRQAQPQHDRAQHTMVAAILDRLEAEFEIAVKAERGLYKGWNHGEPGGNRGG